MRIPSGFLFFVILVLVNTVSALNHEGEALISLLNPTRQSKFVELSWNLSSSTPCYWRGIRCDHRHRVISVNISRYGITGQLGQEIGRLIFLKKLDLSMNSFSGKIPSGLGNCSQLKHLDLSTNSFVGEIPENLKKLSHLRLFSVNKNTLSGVIPDFLFQIPHLRFVSLGYNSFNGFIPPSVGNLTEITSLRLNHNQLSGKIPDTIGNCTKLEQLHLNDNNLVGNFPTSMKNLINIVYLDVGSNRLQGVLPSEMTDLPQLKNISLYNNKFSGVIPQTLGFNTSLEHLDFTNNSFSGKIPSNLCFRNQLKVLHLGENLFQDSIPSSLGSCSTMKRLILQHNNLSGALPQFTHNQNLLLVDISRNSVTGTIPSSLGNCRNLISISFSRNKLTGSIPRELGDLVRLQKLNLSHNNLHGPLPSELSKCISFYSLDVGFNSLNASIPSSLRALTNLSALILSENQFSGGIPDFWTDFKMLLELRLGGNPLGGHIPPSIGELSHLTYSLNLSDNKLTGKVPNQLFYLRMLERLDLSLNNLTGNLSPLLGLASLLEVNISYNFFHGSLPCELRKFLKSRSSFLGNPDLHVSCDHLDLPFVDNFSQGLSKAKIAMIACGSFFSTLFILLVCFRIGIGSSDMTIENRKQDRFGYELDHLISLQDLMKATDNLNERFIIGRGANGVVYKAEFESGNLFAVKKLVFSGHRRANISMQREIQTVGTIKHRNLVRLKDYWFQKEYGLILYAYMPNGSLHDVLHEISPPPYISWDVRYKIALGTAEGLAYVHNDCNPAIVHQDIKPKNILLDADMEPHISDFGIAKLMDDSPASIRTITCIGTVGYIAPEIAYTMMKNKGTDVYSYGVVLLELITRKKVFDPSFHDDMNIVKWAHTTWRRTKVIDRIVDLKCCSYLSQQHEDEVKEQMKRVLLIALQCTEREPRKRPTMREVVNLLKDGRT